QNPNVPYDVKYDITDYGNIKIIDFNNSGENEISFLKALSKTEKQIEICITEDFAECFGNEFLLFSEQDAKDFADAKNAEEPFKFSTEYLNGKTLYNTSCDDNQWQMAPFSFNDKTFTAYIEEDPTQRMDDVSYNITQEGYINFENEGDESYIKALETTSVAMSVCWEDSVENATKCSWSNEYFYFDYETAKKLVDTKNANEDFEGCHGDDGGHSESRECEVGVDGCEEVTVSGKVIFKDAEGNIIDTPEDARVRLSSDVDMENNHYGKYFNNITLSPQGDFSATAKVQPNSYQSGHKINVDIYKENGEEPHYYNCGENSYKGTLINFDELQSLEVTPNDFQDNSSQTCD
ncbi:MAG: hypothetical protein U9R50_00995, partial [Campylobacterota bacterium]|nr:hypothetical protein [Campylobacterota bacterium]